MAAAPGSGTLQWENASAEAIFEALRDFRSLTRERALEALRDALLAGRFEAEAVEALVFAALRGASWEEKQGGLSAAAEAVRAWDRAAFREAVLEEVPRLLLDSEYRVRKAVALVLKECCLREGLSVFDRMQTCVLGDIQDKFQRAQDEDEDDPNKPPAPPTFLHDTEGWRSLETSMGALEAMMQGCGTAFTPRIDSTMIGLLADCTRHTNRFVREYAYFALKNTFDVCNHEAFLATVAPQTVGLVAAGIKDNWSQVRYAASVAVRAFIQKAGDEQERFLSELLGPMCLNRHYVAEGVRLYSQETWRILSGPQGGARLLMAHFDSVLDAYVYAAEASNHAVREAACHCISEFAARVAGSPENPTPHRCHFTPARVERLMQTLLGSFQDESWPVRDVASLAIGHFVKAFPEHCAAHRGQLVDLWFDQMADNIPSLRRNGAASLTMAVGVWPDLWSEVIERLASTLPSVLQQPENSEIFSDYTPSGPFSVPKSKPKSLDAQPDPAFTDKTMYSCGSVAPKTFKKRVRVRAGGGGCMNCDDNAPHQPWEASEGMAHLLVDLAELNAAAPHDAPETAQRAESLAALLPDFATAYDCSQYRHHYMMKQKVCERLPGLTEALGPQRMRPAMPALLKTTADCAAQSKHHGLRESARIVLAAWRKRLSASDVEDVCNAAAVDPSILAVE